MYIVIFIPCFVNDLKWLALHNVSLQKVLYNRSLVYKIFQIWMYMTKRELLQQFVGFGVFFLANMHSGFFFVFFLVTKVNLACSLSAFN